MAKRVLERAFRFRLNHHYYVPGTTEGESVSVGGPGDVVELSLEVAERLERRGGGTIVADEGEDGDGVTGPDVSAGESGQ